MKIIFGIPYREHREIALDEVTAFSNLGWETDTAHYSNSGKVKGVFRSLFLVLKNAWRIKRKVQSGKADVIYLNTSFDYKTILRDSITIFILRLSRTAVNIVLKVHGSDERYVKSKSILKQYIFIQANLFLLLSEEEKTNFIEAGLDVNKIRLTANPVSTAYYHADPNYKTRLGLHNNEIVLLFVGRFIREKGILDLIESCVMMTQKGRSYLLICLGSGPLENDVKALIHRHGLTGVRLMGYIPELETRNYYANCDILILPTYHCEGFPMAVFQAVAAGKPVITTRIRAAADHLTENENCLWVKSQDPTDLSDKIDKLSGDLALRSRMSVANRLLATEFSADKIARRFIFDYEQSGKG